MEKRYLRRNLSSSALLLKISAAERRMEAGERELGFYLLDLKRRLLYRDAKCATFHDFICTRTGLAPKKANELVRVALALDSLPRMDAAFCRGEIYWSAVRAMTTVATPQDQDGWIEYAKSHRVNEVERKVATTKAGEGPNGGGRPFRRRPQRFPYEMNVTAEKHQGFELLTNLLSKRKGREVTLNEALAEAADLKISELLQEDAGLGQDRNFPSSFRRVIYHCLDCREHAVAIAGGRASIDPETAERLLQGAEVLDLTVDSGAETSTDESSKSPIWANVKTEVIENSRARKKPARGEISGELVQHDPNLSTPDRPMVPLEERDIPNTPEITKKVLSRGGYYCRVEGCTARFSEAPAPEVQTPAGVPPVMDRSFWLAHRHRFEWSERRKALVYHPEWIEEGTVENETAEGPAPGLKTSGSQSLESFQGQPRAVRNLGIAVRAAKLRNGLPPPILLSGPAGLGKTTLAKLIAGDLGARLHQVQGPALLDLGALLGVLAGIERGAILFIDEIHRVPAAILECLYQALDDRVLSLPVIHGTAGANVRFVNLEIEPFLLIGATTEESLLPKPLRSRFTLKERLELYARAELEALAVTAGSALGIEVTNDGAHALAGGARGTPRILLGHLARARDFAQVECLGSASVAITGEVARQALACQGIDESGLSAVERKLLDVLLKRNRPLGLRTLSDLVGESPRTILEVHEPYLVHEGFLARTLRGRVATDKARKVTGLSA